MDVNFFLQTIAGECYKRRQIFQPRSTSSPAQRNNLDEWSNEWQENGTG